MWVVGKPCITQVVLDMAESWKYKKAQDKMGKKEWKMTQAQFMTGGKCKGATKEWLMNECKSMEDSLIGWSKVTIEARHIQPIGKSKQGFDKGSSVVLQ